MAQNKAELDILQHSQRELSLGKNKLDSILTSLNKEKVYKVHLIKILQCCIYIFDVLLHSNIFFQSELEQNIQVLRDKEIELEMAISKLSKEDNIDIDDAVTTTAPLYKQ